MSFSNAFAANSTFHKTQASRLGTANGIAVHRKNKKSEGYVPKDIIQKRK